VRGGGVVPREREKEREILKIILAAREYHTVRVLKRRIRGTETWTGWGWDIELYASRWETMKVWDSRKET
jgi:hypothetical protein